jgi:pyruvate kinase
VGITYDIKIDLMVVFSDDIEIAKAVSKYHPNCLVVYPTTDELQVKYLRLVRGIYAIHIHKLLSVDELLKFIYSNSIHEHIVNRAEKALILNIYLHYGKNHKNGYYIHTII